MTEETALPRRLLLLIAAIQGICLMLLYEATDAGNWPSQDPLWSFPLWTLALAVPVLLLLSLDGRNTRSVMMHAGILSVVLALLAIYVGWQAEPFGKFPISGMVFAFSLSIALACFKALMYLQQRAANMPMTYDILFRYSWRNFLTLSLSVLFTFVFWLILMLWAALFSAIDIDFFKELFRAEWFMLPLLGIAHGFGIVIFRNLVNIIDSITRLLQGLIKLLLPLVLVIAVIFLAALPFVGLDALWDTGSGTSLLLWLLALTLFFTNAVYQDGRGVAPYPGPVHRFLWVALLAMPIVSVLSFYGLYLRLDQYGWSVERCWAFVVWLVLSLFAVGYVVSIVRQRDRWTEGLAKVNTSMGLVVLALMLLANSPLLDFRKISIASQLDRLESGLVELRDFDFWYANRTLARPGYLAVEAIREDIGDSDADLLAHIDSKQRTYPAVSISTDEFWQNMTYRPAPFAVPDGLKEAINADVLGGRGRDSKPFIVQTDLDEDGTSEYALIVVFAGYISSMSFYHLENDVWRRANMNVSGNVRYGTQVADMLKEGEIVEIEPRFRHLRIGEQTFVPIVDEPEKESSAVAE